MKAEDFRDDIQYLLSGSRSLTMKEIRDEIYQRYHGKLKREKYDHIISACIMGMISAKQVKLESTGSGVGEFVVMLR